MGTVLSLINVQPVTTPPPSALAVATPDIVSTKQTSTAPTATLKDANVADDTQPHAPVLSASAAAPATANAAATGLTGGLTGNLNASGPSASFLAQLYSQDNDSGISLATSFAHFAPAPLYNEFVQYGYIKYRPSDAGVPESTTPAAAASTQNAPAQNAPAQNNNVSASLAAGDAYSNTLSRNQSNLTAAESPQITLAG